MMYLSFFSSFYNNDGDLCFEVDTFEIKRLGKGAFSILSREKRMTVFYFKKMKTEKISQYGNINQHTLVYFTFSYIFIVNSLSFCIASFMKSLFSKERTCAALDRYPMI